MEPDNPVISEIYH